MKRHRTFDLVSYLQRLHLLPERLTRKTEAEDLLKQLYDHEKSTGKAPDRLTRPSPLTRATRSPTA